MSRLTVLAFVLTLVLVNVPHSSAEPGHGQFPMVCFVNGVLWTTAVETGSTRTAQADTTETEKKKRQKKRPTATEGQTKDTDTHKESNDNEGPFDSCLGGCLGALLESLCSGLFSDDTDQVTTTPVVTEDGIPVGGVAAGGTVAPVPGQAVLALPYLAALKPLNPYDSALDIWDVPGGASAGGEVMAELNKGSRVNVVERDIYNNTEWVKVRGAEVPEPGGWLQEREVSPINASPGYEEPGMPVGAVAPGAVAQSIPDIKTVQWGLLADLSVPVFGNTMLNEEYKSGFRVGAETRFFFVHSLQLNLSFGFSHSNGEPQYDYVTPSIREAPIDSDLDIWSIGARVGQLFAFPTGGNYFFVSYDIGPAVFNVRESATLELYEGKELTGIRKDKLSKWKVGGDLKLEVGSIIKGSFPLSFHTRFSVIPWDSKEEKSLTLDFLNDNSIYVFNFGVSFGYMFY